jgi:low affinity Fe/Cu permease
VPEPDSSRNHPRPPVSRLLSRFDRWTSRPLTALIVLAGAAVWVLVSLADGFPGRWETIFQTLVAALTLAMVFVIQHTQARQQAATQRKLDEILQAMPGADNSLLTLEHASDDELRATGDLHHGIRQEALGERPGSPGAGRLAATGQVRRD